jgi:hypothetical protein
VATKYILVALSIVFVAFAIARMRRQGGRIDPAAKTWLIITLIFAAVSTWLFLN